MYKSSEKNTNELSTKNMLIKGMNTKLPIRLIFEIGIPELASIGNEINVNRSCI